MTVHATVYMTINMAVYMLVYMSVFMTVVLCYVMFINAALNQPTTTYVCYVGVLILRLFM